MQYDCVMEKEQKEPSLIDRASAKFQGYWKGTQDAGKPIDRQLLAFETYLPKWNGFVTSGGADMKPVEALEQVGKVCECLTSVKVRQGSLHLIVCNTGEDFPLGKVSWSRIIVCGDGDADVCGEW